MNQAEPEDSGRTADAARQAATFEEIISGWVSEGTVPDWPGDVRPPSERSADAPHAEPGEACAPPAPARPAQAPAARPAPTEHYIPPDPPPMPRLGVTASIGLALLGFGVVMLVVPGILGTNSALALPLGLVSLALGLGWFVLRSWPAVSDDDDDDGAVI